jgi:hypothetical protein
MRVNGIGVERLSRNAQKSISNLELSISNHSSNEKSHVPAGVYRSSIGGCALSVNAPVSELLEGMTDHECGLGATEQPENPGD